MVKKRIKRTLDIEGYNGELDKGCIARQNSGLGCATALKVKHKGVGG
jgi:hypothetical protein